MAGGLLVAAQVRLVNAYVDQRASLTGPIARLAEQG